MDRTETAKRSVSEVIDRETGEIVDADSYLVLPESTALATTGRARVPETIESTITHLNGVENLLTASHWHRAAYVYAWTRDGEPGERVDLTRSTSTTGYTPREFADLGIIGLKSDRTVRTYRDAWKAAIQAGEADDIDPGDEFELPGIDWKEAATTAQRIVASNENEWYTPRMYLSAARDVLGGIDLDPASSDLANQVVEAAHFYTQDDDGLNRDWFGRVWLNPPYGRLAGSFIERLVAAYDDSEIEAAIALVNAHCTDTSWFQPLWDHVLCFTDHRIDFDSAGREKKTTSTHGSVFVYLGRDPDRFADEFEQFGAIVGRWQR